MTKEITDRRVYRTSLDFWEKNWFNQTLSKTFVKFKNLAKKKRSIKFKFIIVIQTFQSYVNIDRLAIDFRFMICANVYIH